MRDTDWAYLAGIVDGEGCITYRRNGKGRYYTRVTISQKRTQLLDWIVERFGGAYSKTTWTCGSRHSEWILTEILPYLVVKKDQAEVALELCRRGVKGNRMPLNRQKQLADQLKELKRD